MKKDVVALIILWSVPLCLGQTLDEFRQMKLYEMTNRQLDSYLRLASREPDLLGEKVAQFACQYLGHTYDRNSACHTDVLGEGSMTMIAIRSLCMAEARSWEDYYVLQLRMHFRDYAPIDRYRIRWYPLELAEYCDWIVEDVAQALPKENRTKPWYTYHSWGNWKHKGQADKRRKFNLARISDSTLASIQTGDVVFFMGKLGAGSYKDLDVGIALRELDGNLAFIQSKQNGRIITIVKDSLPSKIKPQLGDGLIIYRPKLLLPGTLDSFVKQAKQTYQVPLPDTVDEIMTHRTSNWFNLPEVSK